MTRLSWPHRAGSSRLHQITDSGRTVMSSQPVGKVARPRPEDPDLIGFARQRTQARVTAAIRVIHQLSRPLGEISSGEARTEGGSSWSGLRRFAGSPVRVGARVLLLVICWSFLEFAASRAWPNTMLAYARDPKAFFSVVAKEPVQVRPADVMAFVTAQRQPRRGSDKVVQGLAYATVPPRGLHVDASRARSPCGGDSNLRLDTTQP